MIIDASPTFHPGMDDQSSILVVSMPIEKDSVATRISSISLI